MKRLILKNVNIFDGVSDGLLENQTMVIENGKIADIFPEGSQETENGKSKNYLF